MLNLRSLARLPIPRLDMIGAQYFSRHPKIASMTIYTHQPYPVLYVESKVMPSRDFAAVRRRDDVEFTLPEMRGLILRYYT
jgi:hypothetical protein